MREPLNRGIANGTSLAREWGRSGEVGSPAFGSRPVPSLTAFLGCLWGPLECAWHLFSCFACGPKRQFEHSGTPPVSPRNCGRAVSIAKPTRNAFGQKLYLHKDGVSFHCSTVRQIAFHTMRAVTRRITTSKYWQRNSADEIRGRE